jgi:ribonuclease HII
MPGVFVYDECMIVGIDEVGRGPWAGPLVMAAVVLGETTIGGLTDSKKLTKKRRQELAEQIQESAAAYGIGWVEAAELDQIGLSAALTLACRRALEQIDVPYHEIIIDGTVNFLRDTGKGKYVTTMKKADLLIASVSAASILAKVARDDFMATLDESFPEYGFSSHVGYGTAKHKSAVERHGLTPQHRRSFAPIRVLSTLVPDKEPAPKDVSVGTMAEGVAAEWLGSQGYVVVERNWKTRFCEIDIVAQKDDTLWFVEVKYRKQAGQGGGIAAITPAKLRRMRFAAQVYLKYKKILGSNARLYVITLTGSPPKVESSLVVE